MDNILENSHEPRPVEDSGRTSPELLERLRTSPLDEEAWTELVHQYGPMIYSWCRRWKLQDADARDVTQIVLTRIAERIAGFRYDPTRSFRAYLKTLAYYSWVELLKSRKQLGTLKLHGPDADPLASVEARRDLVRSIEEAHEQHVLALAMSRVRDRVEPRSWQAFELLAIDGLPGAEVAGRLGLSILATFKAKSRVQGMIRQEVQELDPS